MAQVNLEFEPAHVVLEKDTFDVSKNREDTRSFIAKIFIFSYFATIFLLILLTALSRLSQDIVKDYLLAIGTPLGFVVGFYFKSAQENN